MRAPFIHLLRHRASAMKAFANPFLRPQTAAVTEARRAGHDDGRLLSPRENREAAVRLARTYW